MKVPDNQNYVDCTIHIDHSYKNKLLIILIFKDFQKNVEVRMLITKIQENQSARVFYSNNY